MSLSHSHRVMRKKQVVGNTFLLLGWVGWLFYEINVVVVVGLEVQEHYTCTLEEGRVSYCLFFFALRIRFVGMAHLTFFPLQL